MTADSGEPLDESVALVTGASSGIGEAIAETLAENGADVALAARRETELQMIANRIEMDTSKTSVVPTDVTDKTQVEKAVATTNEELGGIDILVTSAGVMLNDPVIDADWENIKQTVDVNLLGMMNMIHKVLPVMQGQGVGHIVNISSLLSQNPIPGSSAYNATKAGVDSFTESLRQEIGSTNSDIRTTLIRPGLVDTGTVDSIPNETQREQVREMLETISALESEDIAHSVLYAVTQPPHVDIDEVVLRPTEQGM